MEDAPKQVPLSTAMFRLWMLACVALLVGLLALTVRLTTTSTGIWYLREREMKTPARQELADDALASFQIGSCRLAEVEAALGAPDERSTDGRVSVLAWRQEFTLEVRRYYLGFIPAERRRTPLTRVEYREFSFIDGVLVARDWNVLRESRVWHALRQAELRRAVDDCWFRRKPDTPPLPARGLLQNLHRGDDPAEFESAVGVSRHIYFNGNLEVRSYGFYRSADRKRPECPERGIGTFHLYLRSGSLALAPLEPPDPADSSLDDFSGWGLWPTRDGAESR